MLHARGGRADAVDAGPEHWHDPDILVDKPTSMLINSGEETGRQDEEQTG